jgi:hypothetical protein
MNKEETIANTIIKVTEMHRKYELGGVE